MENLILRAHDMTESSQDTRHSLAQSCQFDKTGNLWDNGACQSRSSWHHNLLSFDREVMQMDYSSTRSAVASPRLIG